MGTCGIVKVHLGALFNLLKGNFELESTIFKGHGWSWLPFKILAKALFLIVGECGFGTQRAHGVISIFKSVLGFMQANHCTVSFGSASNWCTADSIHMQGSYKEKTVLQHVYSKAASLERCTYSIRQRITSNMFLHANCWIENISFQNLQTLMDAILPSSRTKLHQAIK